MYRSRNTSFSLKNFTIIILVIFAFACKKDEEEAPPPPTSTDTAYYNDFSGDTALGWNPVKGNWTVDNNVYNVTHNDSLYAMTCAFDSVLKDYIIEVRLRKVSGDIYNVGVIMNGDPTDLSALGNWVNSYKLIIGTNQYWNLGNLSLGGFSKIADGYSDALNPGLGAWNVIRVAVSGGKIQVIFNGVVQGTYTDNTHASGYAGISMFDEFYTGKGEFDYFLIYDLPDGYPFGAASKHSEPPLFIEGYEGDRP